MHFAAVDVGSPAKGNLGWAILGPSCDRGGTDLDELIEQLARVAQTGPLVLGFEAPMYVPSGRLVANLLKARPGEGSRPWSVAAGATTTAIALAVVPWLFESLRQRVPNLTAWQDWTRLPRGAGEVLAFEAFVSGGPSDGHIADARAAAHGVMEVLQGKAPAVSALADEPCLSLLGAALLRAGLTDDIAELKRPCLVVRAAKTQTSAVGL